MIQIDRLETHDRLKHFTKQEFSISECCQDMINQAPFGNRPFYIFAHPRTDDDGVRKRMIWQPRLTKPKAQTNSMLFKGHPGTDVIQVVWIIPPREVWEQFEVGKITHNKTVLDSIIAFQDLDKRKQLEAPDDDDPKDAEVNAIYAALSNEAKNRKMMRRLWLN